MGLSICLDTHITKFLDQMASQWDYTKHLRASFVPFSDSFKSQKRDTNTLKSILKPPSPWWCQISTKPPPKKNKIKANIFGEYRHEDSQQNTKLNPATHKNCSPWPNRFQFQTHKDSSKYTINYVIYRINKRRDKNLMIISIDAEKKRQTSIPIHNKNSY